MPKIIILVLIACLGASCKEERAAVNFQQAYEGKISEGQSRLIHTEAKGFFNQTQLSIAIIKGGKPSYYGVKIENDTLFTVENQDQVFEIGSISKFFTATLLADLNLEGKLNLTPYEKAIGLGWMIENKKNGKWLWHGGGTGGYASSLTLDIERKNAIIILSNVSGFSEKLVNISNLGSRLLEMIED